MTLKCVPIYVYTLECDKCVKCIAQLVPDGPLGFACSCFHKTKKASASFSLLSGLDHHHLHKHSHWEIKESLDGIIKSTADVITQMGIMGNATVDKEKHSILGQLWDHSDTLEIACIKLTQPQILWKCS